MNIRDLMVGDWVKIKTYGVSDKFERTEAHIYVKVAEIGSGLITVDYNNDIKEPYRIYENTEIEPIQLTPEILKKNGFEYYHKNFASLRYDHPFKLKMEKWPDENGLRGLWSITNLIKIRYVHELQHALSLCEIEKEIVL